MKKALITGITGQDGSYLAEILLDKDYEVHGIIRRCSTFNTDRIDHLYNNANILDKKLFLHYGDLNDGSNISKLVSSIKPDEIYNLGAQSHVKVSFEVPEYTADIDGIGALRLLTAMKEYCPKSRFYQASTSELYGGIPEEMPERGYDENSKFHPRSPYGAAKLYAYWITRNFREAYGLYSCNGILFNHEGPRRGKTFVTRKITSWIGKNIHYIKNANSVTPLKLGNLNAKRDWSHAKDCCEAMHMMLQQNSPEDYVIASGEYHTVREFAEIAFKSVGFTLSWKGEGVDEEGYINIYGVDQKVIEVDPKYYRPAEVEQLLGNPSKAIQMLGWKPTYNFKDLVEEMVKSDIGDTYGKRF